MVALITRIWRRLMDCPLLASLSVFERYLYKSDAIVRNTLQSRDVVDIVALECETARKVLVDTLNRVDAGSYVAKGTIGEINAPL